MIFNLFKKHCPICGVDMEKEKAVKRFGKYLCSEEHAEKKYTLRDGKILM